MHAGTRAYMCLRTIRLGYSSPLLNQAVKLGRCRVSPMQGFELQHELASNANSLYWEPVNGKCVSLTVVYGVQKSVAVEAESYDGESHTQPDTGEGNDNQC